MTTCLEATPPEFVGNVNIFLLLFFHFFHFFFFFLLPHTHPSILPSPSFPLSLSLSLISPFLISLLFSNLHPTSPSLSVSFYLSFLLQYEYFDKRGGDDIDLCLIGLIDKKDIHAKVRNVYESVQNAVPEIRVDIVCSGESITFLRHYPFRYRLLFLELVLFLTCLLSLSLSLSPLPLYYNHSHSTPSARTDRFKSWVHFQTYLQPWRA
jgi:hypothetical protein